jgi:hypothetical protein
MFNRRNKMTDAEKAEFKKEILGATTVCPNATKSKKASKMSPNAEALLKALEGMPSDWQGRKANSLKKMFEAVLGEKLEVKSAHITDNPRITGNDFKKFTAIVPEENSNGTDYTLGNVVIVYSNGQDRCFDERGGVGGHLDPADCRFATADEIDKFLDSVQKRIDVNTIVQHFG